MKTLHCRDCDVEMTEGWILDVGKGSRPSLWVEGRPEPSFWTVNRVPKDKAHPILAYACGGCGRVELFIDKGQGQR